MKTYDELLAERDALAAQNAALIKAIKAIENDCIECSYDDESGYFVGNDSISDACELSHYTTPQQCLAEIKAEAGLVGYFRGTDDAWRDLTGGPSPEQMTAHRALEYSNQVRQGDTE